MIDISILDCQVSIPENAYMRYHITGDTPKPLGTRHPTAVPFQAFPTKDGYLVLALAWGVPNQWALLCAELRVDEIHDNASRVWEQAGEARVSSALDVSRAVDMVRKGDFGR